MRWDDGERMQRTLGSKNVDKIGVACDTQLWLGWCVWEEWSELPIQKAWLRMCHVDRGTWYLCFPASPPREGTKRERRQVFGQKQNYRRGRLDSRVFQFSTLRCGSNLSLTSLWRWPVMPRHWKWRDGEMQSGKEYRLYLQGTQGWRLLCSSQLQNQPVWQGQRLPLGWIPILSPYTDSNKYDFHSSVWGNKTLRKNKDLAITFFSRCLYDLEQTFNPAENLIYKMRTKSSHSSLWATSWHQEKIISREPGDTVSLAWRHL